MRRTRTGSMPDSQPHKARRPVPLYTETIMIPLRDVIPSRTFPALVITLIALNAFAFLFELTLSDRQLAVFVHEYGLVPATFSFQAAFTSMFLHGGWMHFLGNMLFLWIFGDNVEDRLGHGRFVAFYLLCGTVASLAHVLSEPGSLIPTIGASGAVAGVMGAYFVLYPHSRILTLLPLFIFWPVVELPAVLFLGLWFMLQLFSGVGTMLMATQGAPAGGIAFWAHVAGFLSGVVFVYAFRRPERARVEWWDDSGPRSYRA
jgi:membrane associated rhomboid family serine protease